MRDQRSFTQAVITILGLLAGCVTIKSSQYPVLPNHVIYSLSTQPSNIDPHIIDDSVPAIPLRQVYDTLVYRDPKTRDFVPGLAVNWTISEDGLTYTFKLRSDVRFHDGTLFTAQSVAANLDRILELGIGRSAKLLGPFYRYQVIDEYTIQLLLSKPFVALLDSLSQVYLGVASPTALDQYSPNRYQFHQVGTGPFMLEEYIPGERITLARNPNYGWGPPFYVLPDAPIDKVTFLFGDDVAARIRNHKLNAPDFVGELSPQDARQSAQDPSIRILPIMIVGTPIQFMINVQQFPTNNLNVRQALIYATNRNLIVDTVYQRFAPVAWGPLSANTPYYARGLAGVYSYDPTQTRNLLQNIGYQDANRDGILEIGGIDLSIRILVPPWDKLSMVSQMIVEQWRIAGIQVILEPLPTLSKLREKVQSGDYNLAPIYATELDPAFLSDFYGADTSNNWTRYSDTILDDILGQAGQQRDSHLRRELYWQAQHIIMNNSLILPIVDQFRLIAVSSRVEELGFDAYGLPILSNVCIARG
jgi:peptide/nickel transport system substrate-binding protein